MSMPNLSAASTVTEAINTRKAVRAFCNQPVSESLIREILTTALQAPSSGNLQPWKVYVVAGSERDHLVQAVIDCYAKNPSGEEPEFNIYPQALTEPYNSRRREAGEVMYSLIGIPRHDKERRLAQVGKNFEFFGAPVGLIITIDKQMEQMQFADLGLLMQNIMLLARERGLHTCPQAAWSMWQQTVRERLDIPDNELIFCGMSLGYADPNEVINNVKSSRENIESLVVMKGF
tara:strand:+ start:1270 stop:1968 length:699 start_codon:yes stop_codon:yes gene_type:complete